MNYTARLIKLLFYLDLMVLQVTFNCLFLSFSKDWGKNTEASSRIIKC